MPRRVRVLPKQFSIAQKNGFISKFNRRNSFQSAKRKMRKPINLSYFLLFLLASRVRKHSRSRRNVQNVAARRLSNTQSNFWNHVFLTFRQINYESMMFLPYFRSLQMARQRRGPEASMWMNSATLGKPPKALLGKTRKETNFRKWKSASKAPFSSKKTFSRHSGICSRGLNDGRFQRASQSFRRVRRR